MGDINSAGHIQTQIISKGSKSPLWSVRKSGQVYLYTYAQATNAIRKINFFVLRKVFQHPVLTMQLLAVHLFMGSFLRETWFCCQAYLHKKSNILKHSVYTSTSYIEWLDSSHLSYSCFFTVKNAREQPNIALANVTIVFVTIID